MRPGALPRRKNIRLPDYDYSLPGGYFVTICAWKRAFLFDRPAEKLAVQNAWEELPGIFAGIELGEYVIMPNHFHGIVWIIDDGAYRLHPGTWNINCRRGEQLLAPTTMERPRKYVALGNIVGAFKTSAASKINRLRGQVGAPVWQRNYFERVIRGEREADAIREYILLNPEQWDADRDNPAHELFDQPARSIDDYLVGLYIK